MCSSDLLQCNVYFDVLRYNTTAIRKNINKNSVVKITTTADNPTGPWSLGLPDVLRVNNVWVGASSFSDTNPDLSAQFTLDNGQRDAYYSLATITSSTPLPAGSNLLISFDVFTKNETQGHGYFAAESYPIDDANTANTTAIQTIDIPLYKSDRKSTRLNSSH